MGFEVQNIGDFDNDGIDDVSVSDYNQYSSPDGEVRVVSGDCMNQRHTEQRDHSGKLPVLEVKQILPHPLNG